jgi:protein-disulfide isomerase
MSRLKPAVDDSRDHAQGSPGAPITLVEYGDYECPHCGRAHLVVKALQRALGPNLRFVFRNFPLSQVHPRATRAAMAAEAAALQGRFWPMHDLLFENQDALEDEDLYRYAEAAGLDVDRFARDIESEAVAMRVKEDILSGARSGVNGTPTFFVNGLRYDGSWEAAPFLATLEQLLQG